jgi:hypothetical protein
VLAGDRALLAEVGNEFKLTAEGFHVAGQAADRGAVNLAVLDLADPAVLTPITSATCRWVRFLAFRISASW